VKFLFNGKIKKTHIQRIPLKVVKSIRKELYNKARKHLQERICRDL